MFAYLGCECGNQSFNADDYAALKILELQRPLGYDPSVNNTSYGRKRLFNEIYLIFIKLISGYFIPFLDYGSINLAFFKYIISVLCLLLLLCC